MKKYFDTHLHLDLINSQVLEQTIKEIEKYKIYTMAVTNLPELFERLENKVESKYVRVCLGFHPELIYEYRNQLSKMWKNLDKTRYIGEVGLDFSNDISEENKNFQIKFMETLILKCEGYDNKIISIHSRKAEKQILEIFKNQKKSKIIMHWYSGSITLLNKFIEKGVYFSINGSMTKSIKGINIIKKIPLDKILIESDYPFVKYSSKQYGKEIIEEIIKDISEIKSIPYKQVEENLFNNFKKILK